MGQPQSADIDVISELLELFGPIGPYPCLGDHFSAKAVAAKLSRADDPKPIADLRHPPVTVALTGCLLGADPAARPAYRISGPNRISASPLDVGDEFERVANRR